MNQATTWLRRLLSARGQCRLAGAAVAISLLPFVVLAFDSHPSLDDFQDAVMRRNLGFWGAQRTLYVGWTGRYFSSLLLMDLSPLRWRAWSSLYFLVPLVTLLAMAGGLYAFFTVLASGAWSIKMRVLAAGTVLSLWLAQSPSVAECLYWYNAVAVYSLPGALFLLWLVVLSVLLQRHRGGARGYWRWWITTALLSIALIGSNEILALMVFAGLAVATLWSKLHRNNQLMALVGLLLTAAVAMPVAFLAPGNAQRLSVINRSVHLGWAALGTVGSSGYLLINWLGNGLLIAATALALPTLVSLANHHTGPVRWLKKVNFWLLTAILLVLLFATGLPSYVATGGMMPLRARTTVYLLFLVGWVVLLLASVGWAQRRWPVLNALPTNWPPAVAALLWGWLLLSFVTDHNVRVERASMGQGSNSIVLAYRDWLSGAGKQYNAQLRERYQQLSHSPNRSLRVAPLAAEPSTLLYYDITTDSAYWGNIAYAQFFRQRAIVVGPGGHAPPP